MTLADTMARLDLDLDRAPATAAKPFHLTVGSVGVTVLCPGPLRAALVDYFSEALTDTPGALTVHLLPGQSLGADPAWTDWAREAGKAGRKDAICDLPGARLIRKVRSGVTFVQAPQAAIAFGPLTQNVSTVINFINTQILNDRLRDGWQLAHAAAVAGHGRGLAISGLSGGGKSTSILRMMDIDGLNFVSNDRVLVKDGRALGIPKHPRINPGTILGNPRLTDMLPPDRQAALRAMPKDALWELEEKYDLMIGEVYGPDRLQYDAPLTDFWVLNWDRTSTEPTDLRPVTLDQRSDLLAAIMKSPGPFYQHPEGQFEPNGAAPQAGPYLAALRGVTVQEVTGRIDFDALAARGQALFGG